MDKQLTRRANQMLQRGEQREEQPRPKHFQDFGDEYLGKEATVYLSDGRALKTRVIDITKYWIKCKSGYNMLYVNKAHIVSIEVVA